MIEIGEADRARNQGKITTDSLAVQLAIAYSRSRQESKTSIHCATIAFPRPTEQDASLAVPTSDTPHLTLTENDREVRRGCGVCIDGRLAAIALDAVLQAGWPHTRSR